MILLGKIEASIKEMSIHNFFKKMKKIQKL